MDELSKIFKLTIEPISLSDIQDSSDRRSEDERKKAPETAPRSIQLTAAGREQVTIEQKVLQD